MPRVSLTTMAERVWAYAEDHYDDGWDVIVECFTVADIEEEIERAGLKTLKDVMAYYKSKVEIFNDRLADAINSAF